MCTTLPLSYSWVQFSTSSFLCSGFDVVSLLLFLHCFCSGSAQTILTIFSSTYPVSFSEFTNMYIINSRVHKYIINSRFHKYILNSRVHKYILNSRVHKYILNSIVHKYIINSRVHKYILNSGVHKYILNSRVHKSIMINF